MNQKNGATASQSMYVNITRQFSCDIEITSRANGVTGQEIRQAIKEGNWQYDLCNRTCRIEDCDGDRIASGTIIVLDVSEEQIDMDDETEGR